MNKHERSASPPPEGGEVFVDGDRVIDTNHSRRHQPRIVGTARAERVRDRYRKD